MKKYLKKIAALLSIAMIIGTVAGCGTSNETVSNDEEVTLKWILAGAGKQLDSDEVWAEFNEQLKEVLPNTKVDIENIAISDYAEKWKLIAASHEEVDMAWHGWVINYEQEVKNGSYLPLDELMEKYAPKLKASMPDWVWEPQMIDGEIYAIPNYQMMVSRPVALRTPKELADKYLDKERAEKAFRDYQAGEAGPLNDECFDVLEDYLQKLKDAGELGKGLTPEFGNWFGEVNNRENLETGYVVEENGKIVIKNAFDESIPDTFYRRMSDFYKKGFIRKDALTIQDYKKDIGTEDGYVLWIHNYDDYTAEQESMKYGKPIDLIKISFDNYSPKAASATNSTIPSTAKHPERAMQLYEVINDPANSDLYNLMVYGIEGKHYKKTGENTIETFGYSGTPTSDSSYGISKWIVGNSFNAYDTQSDVPGYNNYVLNTLHKNAKRSLLSGFKLDTTPIKAELAQINSVKKEFAGLKTGAYENYTEMIAQWREKMNRAGNDKVIAEIQKQIDEQINNK